MSFCWLLIRGIFKISLIFCQLLLEISAQVVKLILKLLFDTIDLLALNGSEYTTVFHLDRLL